MRGRPESSASRSDPTIRGASGPDHRRLRPTIAGRGMVALLLVLLLCPRPGRAQVARTAIGLGLGLVTGVHLTTGVFVVRARLFNRSMHTPEDVLQPRPETAPIVLLPIAGAILGYNSSTRLAGAATWGGAGLVGGAVVGAAAGHLLRGTSQDRWAGATIGSAAGLVIGAILGAALVPDRQNTGTLAAPARDVGFSIPIGASR